MASREPQTMTEWMRQVERRITRMERNQRPSGVDSGWQTITTWENSWGRYGTTWAVPGFRKLGNGLVIMRGLVMGTKTQGVTMFTLPPGYRPDSGGDGLHMWVLGGITNGHHEVHIKVWDSGIVEYDPYSTDVDPTWIALETCPPFLGEK